MNVPGADESRLAKACDLEDLLRAFPDVVILFDRTTMRIVDARGDRDDILGYGRDEARQKTLLDILPTRGEVVAGREAAPPDALGQPLSTICQRKDGDLGLVEVRWTTLKAGPTLGLAIIRELPEPSVAEAELKKVNAFLDAVVENIPDMIFVKDAET